MSQQRQGWWRSGGGEADTACHGSPGLSLPIIGGSWQGRRRAHIAESASPASASSPSPPSSTSTLVATAGRGLPAGQCLTHPSQRRRSALSINGGSCPTGPTRGKARVRRRPPSPCCSRRQGCPGLHDVAGV
jgi:hypothetical protein